MYQSSARQILKAPRICRLAGIFFAISGCLGEQCHVRQPLEVRIASEELGTLTMRKNFENYRMRVLAQCGWNGVINRV